MKHNQNDSCFIVNLPINLTTCELTNYYILYEIYHIYFDECIIVSERQIEE